MFTEMMTESFFFFFGFKDKVKLDYRNYTQCIQKKNLIDLSDVRSPLI